MTFRLTAVSAAAVVTSALLTSTAIAEPKTLMLHQWATGSDAAAIAKLGEMFEEKGGTWEQTAIAGHTANTLAKLRSDVISGNAPAAVQLKGPEIAEWNETGMTANLDDLAAEENWDEVVAPELLPVMKPEGSWVAAPMNIHRINWLWGSTAVMEEAGVEELPGTWEEFNAACDKVVATGKICLSHSTADWTDSTVFEVVVYGMDLDLYRQAFVEGNPDALRSEGMIEALEQFRKMMTEYTDEGMVGRDWDTMSHLVGNGEAAFHIMGDWTVGLLTSGGFEHGTDYVCAQAPTDWDGAGFILNADSVVFFQQNDPDYQEGQRLLASTILSPEFQTIFNQAKGSIPARLDVDISEGFNPCQEIAQEDLQASIEAGTLVRSMAHNMTVPQSVRGAIMDTVTEFVADTGMSAEDGANAMADAVEAQM
ncbi:MAG TPA: ABC transporter substrate-binding protein [Devosiaceae bacterium]|jgi:glucose/mannose transport system substrate-binding protein|nr:ABC transporter substrate-binding protein [Devosiaceae bacterium]